MPNSLAENLRDRGRGAPGAIRSQIDSIGTPRLDLARLEMPRKLLTVGRPPGKGGTTRLPGDQPRDARPEAVTTSGDRKSVV